MAQPLIFSLSALTTLLPAAVLALYDEPGRPKRAGLLWWALIVLALAGPAAWTAVQYASAWRTGLSATLWLTVAATMTLFAALSVIAAPARSLASLLIPYLVLLGALATLWAGVPGHPLAGEVPAGWIGLHIVVSVLTYALLTVAAVAGVAVMLRERALKAKRRTMLTRRLPSVADAERLQVRLLIAAETVLVLGITSGMAAQYFTTGMPLALDHKILFTLGAFLLIGVLLMAHFRTGMRGRHAARMALLGYLLVTLGYVGVKVVTDLLLA